MSETGSSTSTSKFGTSLTLAVAADIGRRIVNRQLSSGMTLPTEPELQDRFGVSRTVVREAVRHLASKGLVSVGPKVGTKVRPSTDWNMLDPEVMEWHLEGAASADFIASLYELRLVFEPEAARLAALRMNEAQKEVMLHALNGIVSLERGSSEHISADLAFHRVILEATGNPVLRSFGAMIENSLSASFRLSWKKSSSEQSLHMHRQVAEAILSGDDELAALHMRRLISIAWKELRLSFVANPS